MSLNGWCLVSFHLVAELLTSTVFDNKWTVLSIDFQEKSKRFTVLYLPKSNIRKCRRNLSTAEQLDRAIDKNKWISSVFRTNVSLVIIEMKNKYHLSMN